MVVFWNFTERQEKDILADLTFASNSPPPSREGPPPDIILSAVTRTLSSPDSAPLLGDYHDDDSQPSYSPSSSFMLEHTSSKDKRTMTSGLMVRPLKEMDVQIEDFHFEYNPRTRSPRIRDDMITYHIS